MVCACPAHPRPPFEVDVDAALSSTTGPQQSPTSLFPTQLLAPLSPCAPRYKAVTAASFSSYFNNNEGSSTQACTDEGMSQNCVENRIGQMSLGGVFTGFTGMFVCKLRL